MAAIEPFEPKTSATVGKGVGLATGATNTSVTTTVSVGSGAYTLLVVNDGPNKAWVRASPEAAPTATAADVLMLGNTTRLFGNPVPNGTLGVAVIVSVTTSPNTVWFIPGEGGID